MFFFSHLANFYKNFDSDVSGRFPENKASFAGSCLLLQVTTLFSLFQRLELLAQYSMLKQCHKSFYAIKLFINRNIAWLNFCYILTNVNSLNILYLKISMSL